MRHAELARHRAGLAAAAGVIGAVLAAALVFGPRPQAPAPTPVPVPASEEGTPGPASVAFGQGHDLDADGRSDAIALTDGGLEVTAAAGGRLLVLSQGTPVGYQVARLGGQFPVLFVEMARGEYRAYAYAPGTGLLQAVLWPDREPVWYGELQPGGRFVQAMVGENVRRRTVQLQLDKLQLDAAAPVYEPLTRPASSPSGALTALVEAVALGIQQELPVHWPDAQASGAFFARWQGRLPVGAVRVAEPDEVNAGGEHGHQVPVTVWLAGDGRVAGLRGEAQFAADAGGVHVRSLDLEAIPLKVDSWAAAAYRLALRHPAAGNAHPADAPFYGVFRFTSPAGRFSVDAITGGVADD